MNRIKQKFNKTPRNLFLLLMVFIFGFSSQAILNLSVSNFIHELDMKVKNSEVENLIGQEIILEIHKIESDFFQMAAFPNKHLRKILTEDILEQQREIEHSLAILNEGGIYRHRLDLNLPNTEEQFEIFQYTPRVKDHFSFARADILPKFRIINDKIHDLTKQLEQIDQMRLENSPKLAESLTKLKLEVKFFQPIFHRIKEDANRIFYRNKLNFQQIQKEVDEQKKEYRNLQILLSLSALVLGLLGFWALSRNISNTTRQIEINQDYTQDILDSQTNIIIVNDGVRIIDASGGFYQFFPEYTDLADFARHHNCICDLFVREEGYLYKKDAENWIEALVAHPEQVYKAKILRHGKETIFQVSAVKSSKYQRYIISMFDITANERINRDLEEQKNKALAATQAKGEFLANMSHEIRTPLNAILGFIGLLKDKPLDEEGKQYLDTIDKSGNSLLGIINDILDFSKIESGKLEYDPVEFDPRVEFNSTADLFKARCSEKNISFSVKLSSALPSGLKTDILRVKQVLTNLLSNAVKFTNPGKSISLDIDYQDGFLFCAVKDQGIGLSEEAQQRIFEAFSQAETATTRKYGGTGLGLTISVKLVEMLGGHLYLKSEPGVGSTFSFNIPAEVVQLNQSPNSERPEQTQPFHGHILLVEDNQTNQMLMSAILKKQGLTFDTAQDGLQALESVQNTEYDLVLMDENMPNMNGIEATKRIRKLPTIGETLPIIALTANAMTGDRERFIQAGMNEYLTKPINLGELKRILHEFLNH
jgi:signal transduction histidine kinase/CheY-like chemotaxis protein